MPENTAPEIDPSTMLTLNLSIGHINQVLAIIAKRPLEEVMDLFNTIRTQGDMQLAARRMNGAAPPPQTPVEVVKKVADEVVNEGKRTRARRRTTMVN